MLIAIDVSKSMLATDVKPNRLERVKFAVKDLVRKLNGDRDWADCVCRHGISAMPADYRL